MLQKSTSPNTFTLLRLALAFIALFLFSSSFAQPVTGVWKGKIDHKKVEVKIIQKGDSLTGTAYYYETANNYRRYSIKGYFDPTDNSVVWWDDQLLEEKGKGLFSAGKDALLSTADFNCPGGGAMYLNGHAAPKENPEDTKGPVSMTKTGNASFPDEWDFVIDNYTMGTNDPDIIDSVGMIAKAPKKVIVEKPVATISKPHTVIKKEAPPVVERTIAPAPAPRPLTIEEKFSTRQKIFNTEIPVTGDSIELRFYDNAEVDGDSISLFLNDRMIFTHIRLTEKAYIVKLPVNSLNQDNELIMVAENLGSIPPNTSYMVAIVGDKRYEARLASTENSSALIKLKKE